MKNKLITDGVIGKYIEVYYPLSRNSSTRVVKNTQFLASSTHDWVLMAALHWMQVTELTHSGKGAITNNLQTTLIRQKQRCKPYAMINFKAKARVGFSMVKQNLYICLQNKTAKGKEYTLHNVYSNHFGICCFNLAETFTPCLKKTVPVLFFV